MLYIQMMRLLGEATRKGDQEVMLFDLIHGDLSKGFYKARRG